jgi:hypothetical protein
LGWVRDITARMKAVPLPTTVDAIERYQVSKNT